MNEKTFRFYGLDVNRAVFGVLFLSVATLSIFVILVVFLDLKSPYFVTLASFHAILFAAVILGPKFKSLWTVNIADETMEIYLNKKFKGRFILPELKKIHIRGWKHKKSYYLLSLADETKKISLIVEGSGTPKFTSAEEMKVFEELTFFLEKFALENDYRKENLRKSFTHRDFVNVYYSRKRNV